MTELGRSGITELSPVILFSLSLFFFFLDNYELHLSQTYCTSLLTFDVYSVYYGPETSSKLAEISHGGIIIYAIALAVPCSILNAAGLSLTWLLTVPSIIVRGCSCPY